MTWGDKMTKAEIDDIFGEFEIDEDYMIKSKDIIGLFVAVKEEPKAEEPAPAPVRKPQQRRMKVRPRRRRRRRRLPSKYPAVFSHQEELANLPARPVWFDRL